MLPVVAVVLIDSYYASRSWNKPVMKLFFFPLSCRSHSGETVLFESRRRLCSNFSSAHFFFFFFFSSQVPHPSDWHLRHRARLQPRGVRHAARLQNQLGLLEPPRPAVHDHVPYVRFNFCPVRVGMMRCVNLSERRQTVRVYAFLRGSGLTNRAENSLRTAVPGQMDKTTDCYQTHKHTSTLTHSHLM